MSTKKIYVTTYTPTPIDHFSQKNYHVYAFYMPKFFVKISLVEPFLKSFLRASQDIAEKTFYSK